VSALKLAPQKAEAFLRENNISDYPIEPISIATDLLGISVHEQPSNVQGSSGMLMRHGNEFAISYATHIQSEGFRRFSVAHELGHYLLAGHVEALLESSDMHESHAGFVSSDRYEREADDFAAGLLMPSFLFRKSIHQLSDGLGAIEVLADIYKSSLTATAIRYVELSDSCSVVVQSHGKTIEWAAMSKSFKEIQGLDWIKKGALLSIEAPTYAFNNDSNNIMQSKSIKESVNLQSWFNGSFDIEITEEIKGLGNFGRTLTVLTIDETDLEEFLDDEKLDDSYVPRFKR